MSYLNPNPGETTEEYEDRMIARCNRTCAAIIRWTGYIILGMVAIALAAQYPARVVAAAMIVALGVVLHFVWYFKFKCGRNWSELPGTARAVWRIWRK